MADGVLRTAVIVDDDPDVRRMLKLALEMTGFRVEEAATGIDGVDVVRRVQPDLITLDLMLPGLGGVEVCRRIRDLTDAYIIMITASADETDRLVGLATGADDYVTKPFSPREVQARVAAMFRRPRAAAVYHELPVAESIGAAAGTVADQLTQEGVRGFAGGAAPDPNWAVSPSPAPVPLVGTVPVPDQRGVPDDEHEILRHGQLAVDIEGRIAFWGDAELSLTKIEFDLLATMIRHPRRAWTRELLLEQVWGSQWTDHHVVEVHIGNLRRKLADRAPGKEIIRTVRGVGYRLAPAD
jgi:two-component system OmpR family response regulator